MKNIDILKNVDFEIYRLFAILTFWKVDFFKRISNVDILKNRKVDILKNVVFFEIFVEM